MEGRGQNEITHSPTSLELPPPSQVLLLKLESQSKRHLWRWGKTSDFCSGFQARAKAVTKVGPAPNLVNAFCSGFQARLAASGSTMQGRVEGGIKKPTLHHPSWPGQMPAPSPFSSEPTVTPSFPIDPISGLFIPGSGQCRLGKGDGGRTNPFSSWFWDLHTSLLFLYLY